MKKIFLFLSAALVSLAMQATVVTQDIALSDFNDNNTATYEDGTITAAQGWQYVQKLSGFDVYGLSDSQVNSVDLVVELSTVPTAEVFVQISYSDKTANDFSITVEQTQGRVALASKNVTEISIKLKAAGSATLNNVYFYKVVGKKEPIQLFDGSETPHVAPGDWNDAWNGRLLLDGSSDIAKFAKAHEGDTIAFTYTSTADQCYIYCNDNKYFEDYANGQIHINASQGEPGAVMKFALRSTDITNLQAGGMNFSGISYTLTDVTLITYSQQIMVETELNSGAEVIDWNQHWVHTSGLPTLAAGDELRVTVSAVTGEYPQVNFRHNDEGTNPVVIEGIDETVPKVYTVSLTAAQAEDINSGKLFIVGQNVTLSHFAIAQPMSIYDENLLWHGEEAAGDNWGNPVNLPASKFSGVEVGDILNVLLTELDAEGQLFLTQGNYADFTVKPNFYLNGNCAAPMALSFVINAFMKDELQAHGLLVSGKKFTVSAVYVIKAEAHTESYFLKVSDAEMATLVLPFNATLPAGVEAYRLTYDGSEAIEATPVSAIQADKPVLIIAAANEDPGYEFVSELGADTCIFYKSTWSIGTYQDGALHGNYVKAFNTPNKYESDYFYVLQKGASGAGFYQLQFWGDVKVNPYRAFLGCSHDLNGFDTTDAPGRKMRIVFHKDATTDIVTVETSEISTQKIIRNGQLFIIRDGKTYDIFGRLVD